MSRAAKALKLAQLLRRRRFAGNLVRHRVAAAVEHLEAIAFCAPATLVDVGANKGQFSLAVRALFPRAEIYAFEPFSKAADRYEKVFHADTNARLHRFALGKKEGTRTFYIADREDSSSLLMPGSGQRAAYGVALSREISVPVKRLEDVLELELLPKPALLKIDVQGTELDVLTGVETLDAFDFIYVELSFVELYESQALFEDVRANLARRGFVLRGMFNQSVTRAFGPTQADCLFVREAIN